MARPPVLPGLFDLTVLPVPQPPPVREERARLNAAAARVLAVLSDGQWHENRELWQPSIGGNGAVRRLWELAQRGHTIEKQHVEGALWRYRLVRP